MTPHFVGSAIADHRLTWDESVRNSGPYGAAAVRVLPTILAASLFLSTAFGADDDKGEKTKGQGKTPSSAPIAPIRKSASAPPVEFDAAREADALAFVRQHHPELATVLEALKPMNPAEYRKAILELSQVSRTLAELKARNPRRYELVLEGWKAKSRVELLAAQLAGAPSEELRSRLRSAIEVKARRRDPPPPLTSWNRRKLPRQEGPRRASTASRRTAAPSSRARYRALLPRKAGEGQETRFDHEVGRRRTTPLGQDILVPARQRQSQSQPGGPHDDPTPQNDRSPSPWRRLDRLDRPRRRVEPLKPARAPLRGRGRPGSPRLPAPRPDP